MTYPNRPGDVAINRGAATGDGVVLYACSRVFAEATCPVIVRDLAIRIQETGVGGARHVRGKPTHHRMDLDLAEVRGWGRDGERVLQASDG